MVFGVIDGFAGMIDGSDRMIDGIFGVIDGMGAILSKLSTGRKSARFCQNDRRFL